MERMRQGRSRVQSQGVALHQQLMAARKENLALKERLEAVEGAVTRQENLASREKLEAQHQEGGLLDGAAAVPAKCGDGVIVEADLRLQVSSLQAKLVTYQGWLEEAHASIAEMQV